MIRVALVGLGWWGRHILACLADVDRMQLVRAVDPRADAQAELAQTSGVVFSTDLQPVLDDARVDAVILATPHSLHVEQTQACAAAGKHVFVEKPLALTRAGAARAIRACEQAGVQLGVGHERRFEPAMEDIERLIVTGELGTIMHVESAFSHDLLARVDPADWRAAPEESPLPAVTGMGIHLTDMYVHLFGMVDEVFALSTTRGTGHWARGDTFSALLRFTSGVTGTISALLETPLFVRFQVFGSQGWVEARSDSHPGQPGITRLGICRSGGPPETRELAWIDSVGANLDAFASAVEGRADYPLSNAEKLENITVFEALVASVNAGAAVRVADIRAAGEPLQRHPSRITVS